jgi:D-3-phosphoglycerate dehydrogenase / 2-oxoglutarate reductase
MEGQLSKKVVLTDHVFPVESLVSEVKAHTGVDLEVHHRHDEEGLIEITRDADAVLVETAHITRRVIENMTRCRLIGRHGVGYDTLDVDAATEAGICVCNVTDYCTCEVADHAMAMMLALARSLFAADLDVRSGGWDVFGACGRNRRIEGQTLGIVGFGKIGQAVARRARGFGLKLLGYDPYIPAEVMEAAGARKVELDDLLATSDLVSLHLPLSVATRHLMDAARLSLMKPTAFIVNTSRGGLVDLPALAVALREGRVAGAGLDVFEQEPPAQDDPLLSLPNVITSPHVGFYSVDSLLDLHTTQAKQVAAVLAGKRPDNLLNPAVLDHQRSV